MNTIKRHRQTLTCLTLVLALTGVGAAAPQGPATIQDRVRLTHSPSPEYRLNPSDVLGLDFRFTPELNQSVTVTPGGSVTLHGVGEVQVAGLTVSEVTQTIERAYSSLLRDPLISVSLEEFRKPYVTVHGEVGLPGQYELRGSMTLTEVIAVAGGLKESAKHSKVWVFHRLQDGTMEGRQFNVKRMLNDGDLSGDPHVDPFDVVFVPKNTLSKVLPFIPIPGVGLFWSP